jgi:uroporphyrinogen-III decarboxylase
MDHPAWQKVPSFQIVHELDLYKYQVGNYNNFKDALAEKENLQKILPVQGNLDPVRLLCGGMTMEDAMKDIYSEIDPSRWIFNLGHGVIKETDIDSIHQLAKVVRSWKI